MPRRRDSAQHCRVFAPLYRQITLTALRSLMAGGKGPVPDRAMAFGDVRAAWQHYLANDNGGRGVVLIGHSQGSGMLSQLLKTMDDPAERAKIVSALLIGTNVERATGDPAAGDFAWMPACASADQAGCVVSYVTFRDTVPPPAASRFGRTQAADRRVLCVNPAALLGKGSAAQAIFSTGGVGASSRPMAEWVAGKPLPTTNFVAVPGLIEARCVSEGGASYLAVTVKGDPADPRADSIVGDVYAGDVRLDDWGLHLIDMPVVMGDLVALTAAAIRSMGQSPLNPSSLLHPVVSARNARAMTRLPQDHRPDGPRPRVPRHRVRDPVRRDELGVRAQPGQRDQQRRRLRGDRLRGDDARAARRRDRRDQGADRASRSG